MAELDTMGHNAQAKLRSLIERAERLNADKAAIAEDLRELFAEVKGEGFDTKIVRKVIKLRAADSAKLQEEEALIDLYMSSIGRL